MSVASPERESRMIHAKEPATAIADSDREHVACLQCGEDDPEALLVGRDNLFARSGEFPVVRCRRCELVYVTPRPTPEALGRHYPDAYFCYRPVHRYFPLLWPFLAAAVHGMSARRLRWLERHAGRLTPRTRLLDVGCGLNHLLRYIHRRRGCLGIGVDFKHEVVAYVRDRLKMPIELGTLSDAAFESDSFDVIFMTEYLEHEPRPLELLREASRVAAPGAWLAIETPFIGGWPARVFKTCWSQLDVPRHLVFPTPATIADLLRRSGWELIEARTYGVPFSLGASLLQTLGCRHMGRLTLWDTLRIVLAGAPTLPLTPWAHEFMFAVARRRA